VTLTQTAIDRELLLVPAPDVADVGPGEPYPAPPVGGPVPDPATPGGAVRSVLRAALVVLAVVSVGMVVQLAVISPLEYRASQVSLLNSFRTEVALGTAPLGPVGPDHHLLPLGSPMALLTIPSLGVRAVVLEGTTASVLTKGPGHFRNTVFPGGAGTSVILGRAAAFGGPFGRIAQLRQGQLIVVSTQVGTSRFRVVRVRPAGARVLAVDLPSGLDCDTGLAAGACVRADITATFVARKVGFDAPGASVYTGSVHVLDIGVPARLLADVGTGQA